MTAWINKEFAPGLVDLGPFNIRTVRSLSHLRYVTWWQKNLGLRRYYSSLLYLLPPPLPQVHLLMLSNMNVAETSNTDSQMAKLPSFYHFFYKRQSELGSSEAAHWMSTDSTQFYAKRIICPSSCNPHTHPKRHILFWLCSLKTELQRI